MSRQFSRDWYFEVGEHNIPNIDYIHKFGRNPDIDTGSFEAIWNGGGDYTGFNATAEETISVVSTDATDTGTIVSSGTATGGSHIIIEDTGATFISDGVIVGDIILIDNKTAHAAVREVTSETTLTFLAMDELEIFGGVVDPGDTYRVVTAGSTGASVIELQFLLDFDYVQFSEFIVLDGLTPVTSVGSYIRNSRNVIRHAGSSGSNAGIITTNQSTTTANIFSIMPMGYNETMIAAYTIPAEQEGHMTDWFATLSSKTSAKCNVRLLARHPGEVFRIIEELSIHASGTSSMYRRYTVPKNELMQGTDIKVMADTNTNNTAVSAGFDLILSTE